MQIRKFAALADCEKAVKAQKDIWLMEDVAVMPSNFLIAANGFAEQWGAFDDDGELLGIILAYPGDKDSYYGHMFGVLPQARDKGVGNMLLAALWKSLREKNVKKFSWTYDPFDWRNSYVYLNKTGGVAKKVYFNFYGDSLSLHHGKLPTHRLLCELNLNGETAAYTQKTEVALPADEAGLRRMAPAQAIAIKDKFFKEAAALIAEGWAATEINFDKKENGAKIIFKK